MTSKILTSMTSEVVQITSEAVRGHLTHRRKSSLVLNENSLGDLKTVDLNDLGGCMRSFEAVLSKTLVWHFLKGPDYKLIDFMGIQHWLLNGLRGWPCTKRRSAPWVWLWYFFGCHNWIILFIVTSKHVTSMASEVVLGHLRPLFQK